MGDKCDHDLLTRIDERMEQVLQHLKKQNGRIGRTETRLWLVIIAIAILYGDKALALLKILG